jgi:hypothetical protein
MLAEVMEWEARGDRLRRAGRLDEAVEAYRRALRHCFSWAKGGDGARTCLEIREKIWAVHVQQFDDLLLRGAHATPPPGAELNEWTAASLWARGDREAAENTMRAAVSRGARSSGEFLERIAAHWRETDPEGSLRLAEWACR